MSVVNWLEDVLEKRGDHRVRCSLPVAVLAGTPTQGRLRDISRSGLRMRVDTPLRAGVDYPLSVDGMTIEARPVWVRAAADGPGFDVGCRFTDGSRMPDVFREAWGIARPRQKRRTIRLAGAFETLLVRRGEATIHAVAQDVSLSGAGIVSPSALAVGTRVAARIRFPVDGIFSTAAEVVHCCELAAAPVGHELGLSFYSLGPAALDRLAGMLRRVKTGAQA